MSLLPVKLVCPYCQAVNSDPDITGGCSLCSSCQKWFTLSQEQLAAVAASEARPPVVLEEKPVQTPAEKIKDTATIYMFASVFVAVIGVGFALPGIANLVGPSPDAGLLFIAAKLWGLALVLYLISQIIHIRALLERK
jgi:predicted ATP-dependent serine protease